MTFSHNVNRRVFLQQAGAASLLAGLMLYKPSIAKEFANKEGGVINTAFSSPERAVLNAVQMQLFPADGDGPSAKDLNALRYLELALTDAQNIEDGDRAYIIEGMAWLEDVALKMEKKGFIQLSMPQQHKAIERLVKSKKGENWISLLIYYLLEALLLDPVYGGNTHAIGWAWLGHQAGFPRPSKTKNYRHYLS